MDPISVCLLGLGRAGSFHLQSLRLMNEAQITCLYDIDRAKAARVSHEHGCRSAESAREAIQRDDVDAVIVATPTDQHFEFVQMALEARKPVLTEKPLGRHLHEIDESFNLSQETGTPLMVAFQRRFDPAFSGLAEAVHVGKIGQLQFVRSVSRDSPVPSSDYIRISGGIFHDCMVHDLDMVCHITREVPRYLSSLGSSFIDDIRQCGDFDNVVAALEFPSGCMATIDINRKSVYGYDQRFEAFGDAGMLQVDNYHNTSVSHASEQGFQRPVVDFSFPTRYREAYKRELECFVRCVRGTEVVPITHEQVRTNHLLACGLERAAIERERHLRSTKSDVRQFQRRES